MAKQLVFLGDSQICRLLNCFSFDDLKIINLAESGASVARALQIFNNFVDITPKAVTLKLTLIVLLGTNNCKLLCFDRVSYKRITIIGRQLFKEVLLLKIPPIPKLRDLRFVSSVNQYINTFHSVQNIVILDSFSPFTLNDQVDISCFELFYGKSKRADLIHLNSRGLRILFSLISNHVRGD